MKNLKTFGLSFGSKAAAIKREFYKTNDKDQDWRQSTKYRSLKSDISRERINIIITTKRTQKVVSKGSKNSKKPKIRQVKDIQVVVPLGPFFTVLGPLKDRLIEMSKETFLDTFPKVNFYYAASGNGVNDFSNDESSFDYAISEMYKESRKKIDSQGSDKCDFYRVVAVREYTIDEDGNVGELTATYAVDLVDTRSIQ